MGEEGDGYHGILHSVQEREDGDGYHGILHSVKKRGHFHNVVKGLCEEIGANQVQKRGWGGDSF